MTDPSYAGQILCFTYPLIGNYGVPDYIPDENAILKNFESGKIQTKGIIANRVAKDPSHYQNKKSLGTWMDGEGISGIEGLDTRELTLHLRETGVMMGAIGRTFAEAKRALENAENYGAINFCEAVSTTESRAFGKNVRGRLALIDCGVKLNKWALLETESHSLMTAAPGIFAGGDCLTGHGTVVEAVAAGQRAAVEMDRYLGGKGELPTNSDPLAANLRLTEEEGPEGRLRAKPPRRDAGQRAKDFTEVTGCFDPRAAACEAKRCLRCDLEEHAYEKV